VAPDAGPMAETTRVIFYVPWSYFERGIHAVAGVLDAGLQSGAPPAAQRRRCICAAFCELRTTNLKRR